MRRTERTVKKLTDQDHAAAFESGWVDSLRGYFGLVLQPVEEAFDYRRGWDECAAYRWADLNGRGVAPDPTYRPVIGQ